jgi:hypothetical protein
MTTAPRGQQQDLKSAIDPWKLRDFLIVAIGLPALFASMFFAMFFGLSNMN